MSNKTARAKRAPYPAPKPYEPAARGHVVPTSNQQEPQRPDVKLFDRAMSVPSLAHDNCRRVISAAIKKSRTLTEDGKAPRAVVIRQPWHLGPLHWIYTELSEQALLSNGPIRLLEVNAATLHLGDSHRIAAHVANTLAPSDAPNNAPNNAPNAPIELFLLVRWPDHLTEEAHPMAAALVDDRMLNGVPLPETVRLLAYSPMVH